MTGAESNPAVFGLTANVSMLFTELPLLDRFAAAADSGFGSTEAWWPFPDTAQPSDDDVEGFLDAIALSGIPLTGLNFYAGDMPNGERGIVSHPGRQSEFMANVELVAGLAKRAGILGCNALYGQRLPGVAPEEHDAIALANLSFAATTMAEVGGTVLVEALAHGLNGDYPLETAEQVASVVSRVRARTGLDNIGFLFDTFHLASNGQDLLSVIERFGDTIGHVQLADAPGRGEPGSGSIDFDSVFEGLRASGYTGLVACEYKPTVPTLESLGWIAETALVELSGGAKTI